MMRLRRNPLRDPFAKYAGNDRYRVIDSIVTVMPEL
jgi:hypothetical protein